MNSENQVAVLQQILPGLGQQQGQEPQLPTSYSGSFQDPHCAITSQRGTSAKFEQRNQRPRRQSISPSVSPFQQAEEGTLMSSQQLSSGHATRSSEGSFEHQSSRRSSAPSWHSDSQSAADQPNLEASAAQASTLEAIQSVASTLGSSLALWGSYITDFVADVVGENDPTDEEIAEAEKQKQAKKKASMENQGSVSGDLAQPLVRRHSRSMSGRLSRGASLRLDGDWQVSPAKIPASPSAHEAPKKLVTLSDDGEDDDAKKDS